MGLVKKSIKFLVAVWLCWFLAIGLLGIPMIPLSIYGQSFMFKIGYILSTITEIILPIWALVHLIKG